LRADVGDDSFKREIVSVDIGNRGKAHRNSRYGFAEASVPRMLRSAQAVRC